MAIQNIKNFLSKGYLLGLTLTSLEPTFHNLEEFYACSRNQRKLGADEFYNKVAEKYQIPEKLKKMKGRYAIQCEIYGPKILKNYLEAKEIKLVVFTIKDIIDPHYLDLEEMIQLCKEMDLKMVEIIEMGDSFNYTLAELKRIVSLSGFIIESACYLSKWVVETSRKLSQNSLIIATKNIFSHENSI